MKKDRRWLKSAIAASLDPQIALPWARGVRRKPQALKTLPTPTRAQAAR
ncbi:hypothetical protein [Pseudotabrizicola formosa]|nr:hypothetical protein [Pseudotabrizicola formosa]